MISVRPESHGFVLSLTGLGMTISMLTGDSDNVAKEVVKDIGINPENCFTRLLPEDKLKWILESQVLLYLTYVGQDIYIYNLSCPLFLFSCILKISLIIFLFFYYIFQCITIGGD